MKKTVFKKRFLFYQDSCQGFWVLKVDPKIYQDNQVKKQKFIRTQRQWAAKHKECHCTEM
jgi:hypothetical protein